MEISWALSTLVKFGWVVKIFSLTMKTCIKDISVYEICLLNRSPQLLISSPAM